MLLLVCFFSVVRADGPNLNDENSVAGLVKAMARQNEELAHQKGTIAALTAALEAKQMDHKHVRLTTGGEVVEMVRAADVLQNIKALEKQVEACARRINAQDAEIARELDSNMAKFAAQEAQVSELSATVAQLTAPSQTRPMPVDAAETTAARRLQEASPYVYKGIACVPGNNIAADTGGHAYPGSTVDECKTRCDTYGDGCKGFEIGLGPDTHYGIEPGDCRLQSSAVTTGCNGAAYNVDFYEKVFPPPPPPPSLPPPAPPPPQPPPPPPAWPPLPATANELRISGRHTAIAFNTNVDGVEAFRCVGVGDRKLTCDGALHATDFVTLEGESLVGKLEEIRQHVGMVPPSTPPQTPPPSAPPTPPPVLYSAHYARVSFGQTPSRSAPGCPGHPETCGINFAFLGANGQRLAPASMFTEDATGWNCPVTALLFDGVGLPCGNCREPCVGLTGSWYGPLTVQMNFSVALSITGYDTNAIDSYSVAYSSDGVIWNQA